MERTKRIRRNWTAEEEQAFSQLITTHPYNLQEAFRIHADKTGRKVKSVEMHYYMVTRFNGNYLITIGKNCMMIGKNRWTPRNVVQPIPIKRSQWLQVKHILGLS